ncbi:MAG: 50S ribosomal protein L19e [Nanoarchaeota archaeon]
MKLKNQRRIAAQILGVGTSKVWLNPEKLSEIKEAITKSDIRSLISIRTITAKKIPHQSRSRSRKLKIKKRKGLRSGQGTRKGKRTARLSRKRTWVAKIRTQRSFLRLIKEKKLIDNNTFVDVMAKAKGGFFRNKRHIKVYLQEKNIFKK